MFGVLIPQCIDALYRHNKALRKVHSCSSSRICRSSRIWKASVTYLSCIIYYRASVVMAHRQFWQEIDVPLLWSHQSFDSEVDRVQLPTEVELSSLETFCIHTNAPLHTHTLFSLSYSHPLVSHTHIRSHVHTYTSDARQGTWTWFISVSVCCKVAVSVLLAELFVSEWMKPNLSFAGEIFVCVEVESVTLGFALSGINRSAVCVWRL